MVLDHRKNTIYLKISLLFSHFDSLEQGCTTVAVKGFFVAVKLYFKMHVVAAVH